MKILFVLPRFPYPLEKGDKLRAYHQIRCLSKDNDIFVFCVSHSKVSQSSIDELRKYCRNVKVVRTNRLTACFHMFLNFLRSRSLQIGYWDSRKARVLYRRYEDKVDPDVLYCQMVRTMTWVSRSRVPKVLDFQDSLSMNTERRMNNAHGLWRFILHYEFKMLRSSEYNSFGMFDAMTIISSTDGDAIPHKNNDKIHVIPNGVNFDYFKPMEREKLYDIVFCGNMHYEPNVNASTFLVCEVLPLVMKVRPDVKVLLAGASPSAAVKKLGKNPNVTVSGWVEDIRECYASSRLFVAPMQIGSGLQNKLLEAMAMQLPCITTTLANTSLKGEPGVNVIVADTPQDLADSIVMLLKHDDIRDSIAKSGYDYVHGNYSWEYYNDQLNTLLHGVARRKLL
ncbi:MAG: glycosyltransferase [Bacteroidales bacterium]|nr:glycosyltransferase [Bacteroidales bacterium]